MFGPLVPKEGELVDCTLAVVNLSDPSACQGERETQTEGQADSPSAGVAIPFVSSHGALLFSRNLQVLTLICPVK